MAAASYRPPAGFLTMAEAAGQLGVSHATLRRMVHAGKDLVFGPADDGGFWLVGARRCPCLPPLFGPVRWSGPDALADALRNLPRRVSVGFAARLADVDDGPSYRRLAPKRGF